MIAKVTAYLSGLGGEITLTSERKMAMLDIIGIGSLNIDYTATTAMIGSLPASTVQKLLAQVQRGAEKFADEAAIEQLISSLGRDCFRATLGGSAFNTICAMAALKTGISTGCVGVAGHTGSSGLDFASSMQELGVDYQCVKFQTAKSCGLCLSLNHDGIRSFLFAPGSNNDLTVYLEDNYRAILEYVVNARLLQVTQFADERIAVLLARLLKEAKFKNPLLQISCDPGYCWLENLTPAVIDIIRMSDFLFLNTIEFNKLAGANIDETDLTKAERILNAGQVKARLIVKEETEIKIYQSENREISEQVFPINVLSNEEIVDATGAGDIFAAGFLTVLLKYGDSAITEAVELGMRFMRAKLLLAPEKLYPELADIYEEYYKVLVK